MTMRRNSMRNYYEPTSEYLRALCRHIYRNATLSGRVAGLMERPSKSRQTLMLSLVDLATAQMTQSGQWTDPTNGCRVMIANRFVTALSGIS